MAEGASVDMVNSVLSAVLQAGSSVAWPEAWLQLHVGAPGAAGTSNPATEATRMLVTGQFGTDPSGGSITNDGTIGPWTSVAATEDYTHFTIWSDQFTGTFGFSGTITGGSVTAGDDFDIPAGTCTVDGTTAS